MIRSLILAYLATSWAFAQLPGPINGTTLLPNGWSISPVGRHLSTSDYVLGLSPSPDGRVLVGLHSGFNPHGLVVTKPDGSAILQRIPLRSSWMGLAWSPEGGRLFVSGGNANGGKKPEVAPIYVFDYRNGRLSESPVARFTNGLPAGSIYWAGLAHHPSRPVLYAANRGTGSEPGHVVAFDSRDGTVLGQVEVEVTPCDLQASPKGDTLFVSNWSSRSVSVIDTATLKVKATLQVGTNPNDLLLARDGRLYVACGNENSVVVIDTQELRSIETLRTSIHPRAPVGSTPNALALDPSQRLLFVANADNHCVAVIHVGEREESHVLGFIPTTWYPSSLSLSKDGKFLHIGSCKGLGGYSNLRGPLSPLSKDGNTEGLGSVKSLQQGSITALPLANLRSKIRGYTRKVIANTPYHDALLSAAKPPAVRGTILPNRVGVGSPIKHVIYIIKENRTYDQVFGDMPQGNGDSRLTIFGRSVTPNQHRLAEEFLLFDNLYCDAEVSVDGHSWSNAGYATDFNEKLWPPNYGGISKASSAPAQVPSSGHIWDLARRKGLTYRSYGEYAARTSEGGQMDAAPGVEGLVGHVSPNFRKTGMRDTDNVSVFNTEFDGFVEHYSSTDPKRRLPNFVVMSLGEDHTQGTRVGAPTPVAAVANNDWAVGQLVDRVSHSPYWKETAIFIIEDDAQNGSDHVDARRTTGLVLSPYSRRRVVDSTLYTTSSMLRSMELLLGLPPMTQFDAAAAPMYAAFEGGLDLTPFSHLAPQVDVNARNVKGATGSAESALMDFSDYDLTPMLALNEILWKSVKGEGVPMPLPIRSFHVRP